MPFAGFGRLSPMDAQRWFQPPRVTTFTLGASWSQIAGANSMRVALLFGVGSSPSTGQISPSNVAGATNTGFLMNTGTAQLLLNHSQHGALVQVAWYGMSATVGSITVIELFLADWPESNEVFNG